MYSRISISVWPWEPESRTGHRDVPVIEGFQIGRNVWGHKKIGSVVKTYRL